MEQSPDRFPPSDEEFDENTEEGILASSMKGVIISTFHANRFTLEQLCEVCRLRPDGSQFSKKTVQMGLRFLVERGTVGHDEKAETYYMKKSS